MTTVYLAARFDVRKHLKEQVAKPLIAAGHTVTSNWISTPPDEPVLDKVELAQDLSLGVTPGLECLADVEHAEAIAVFTDWPSSTGGYHTEFGYALALRKQVHLVGPPLNVFHSISQVTHHASIKAFLKAWGCTLLV